MVKLTRPLELHFTRLGRAGSGLVRSLLLRVGSGRVRTLLLHEGSDLVRTLLLHVGSDRVRTLLLHVGSDLVRTLLLHVGSDLVRTLLLEERPDKVRTHASKPQACMLALVLSCGAPLAAAPVSYEFDPVHSQLVFFVEHMGFSHAIGRMGRFQGELRFDDDDWSTGHVDVRIPVSSLELGDAAWTRALLDDDWFDATAHAQIRFVSTRFTQADEHTGTLTGQLTLLGQSRPVTLAVRLNKVGANSLTLRPSVGFTATTRLSRSDFGMDASKGSVGDEVEIRIEVEARRPKPKKRR